MDGVYSYCPHWYRHSHIYEILLQLCFYADTGGVIKSQSYQPPGQSLTSLHCACAGRICAGNIP